MNEYASIHEFVRAIDDDPDRWVLLKAALTLVPEHILDSPITVGPRCRSRGDEGGLGLYGCDEPGIAEPEK